MPVPEEFKDSKNLKVIYITAEGAIEELETKIVVEDENTYLEFKTDHFSIYRIMEDTAEVVVEEPVKENPILPIPEIMEVIVVAEVVAKEESNDSLKTVAKEEENLPKAGSASPVLYSFIGMLMFGSGLVLMKKEKEMKI